MIKNIRHTGIVVKDLEKSLYFYQGLLGFKIVKRQHEPDNFIDKILKMNGAQVETIKMAAVSGQLIELLHYTSPCSQEKQHNISDIGISHLAFSVEKLDEVYQLLLDNNVQFLSAPQVSPDGFAKVAFCLAPEGTFIELAQEL